MSGFMILMRSVTYAQRAQRFLAKKGINTSVVRLDANITGVGCGFAVKVPEIFLAEAIDELKKQGFALSRVLIVEQDGSTREMRI